MKIVHSSGPHDEAMAVPSLPASRVLGAILISVAVVVGIALVMDYQVVGAFEAFGATKRYGLPLVYLIFLVALFLPTAGPSPRTRLPLWWTTLLVLLVLSTLTAIAVPRQGIVIDDLAQSMALIGSLLVLSWVGLLTPHWKPVEKLQLLYLLGIVGLVSSALELSLGPFVAVPIPVAFGLVYAGLRQRRPTSLILGVATLVAVIISLREEVAVSISLVTQVSACALLLIGFLLPRALRALYAGVIALTILLGFFLSPVPALMFGRTPPGLDDVTLLHRGYEAQMVQELLDQSPISLFVGVGPSATVDLTDSPDAVTLVSSGRVLEAVDDVHFLSSWALMKLGALGLFWLILIYAAIVRELISLGRQPRPAVFETFLLMFVLAGAISGIPAATNFFANPLAALFLGVLISRRRAREEPLPRPTPGEACLSNAESGAGSASNSGRTDSATGREGAEE